LRLFGGFLLGLQLQPAFLSTLLGTLLCPLLLAVVALAADRLEEDFEIVGAVVVVDFLARLDGLDGADDHLALARIDVRLGVRAASVVDIAGDILARGAVDGPAIVDFKQILVVDVVVLLVLRSSSGPK
jgi:hypothetical protein